ncbi:MAG: ABC transporter substrate-binding protein [Candidatus Dormibacteraeota bacterium]|nr:ABC transporter substrate-binding protein [Candidatus Dormibacteraeota bacterium]
MKRLAVLVLLLLLAVACGGGNDQTQANSSGNFDWNSKAPAKPVKVTFWHGFSAGANQDAVNALAAKFNDAHKGEIEVTPVYAGDYDTTFAKLKAAIQSGKADQLPSMVQIYDIGTRFMIDSQAITPAQTFIDHEKYSSKDLEPNILGYYQINGKLFSMPWNVSTPLLYFNRDAFSEAGLDPNKPPGTLAELRAAAEKLTKKDATGATVRYGFGAAIYGWFLEQFTARADQTYCNNGNGRDKSATKVVFNQPVDVKVVDWWANMVKDGLALNTGRQTPDAQNAFKAGKVAMNLESTGTLRGYQAAAKFQLGTAPYPKVESSTTAGGTIIGGASLWVLSKRPAYEQKAAWELEKFLEQGDSMAYWHTHTGYFPVDKKALDDPTDRDWVAKYPQFKTAIDQLHATKLDKATQGCLLGVMPATRQAAEVGMETAITGKAPAKKAMDDAAANIQPQIDQYNQATSGG